MEYAKKSPHIRCENDTRSIMQDVLVALIPSFVWGMYVFGLRTVSILLLSVLSCLLTEWLGAKLLRRKDTLWDLSAVVTGFLLAAGMPVSVPLFLVPLGAFLAIGIGKVLFGGLGKNWFNPALFSLAALHLFFPDDMLRFTRPFAPFSPFQAVLPEEVVAGEVVAHPLAILKEGALPEDLPLSQMLSGSLPGTVGEVSTLLLLAGFLYLLVRRVISWHIPVCYLGTFSILSALFPLSEMGRWEFLSVSVLTGSVILGALFMATDPVTSPVTKWGKVFFGILCGALTVLLRRKTAAFDGVIPAILLAEMTTGIWDFLFRPRVYGKRRDLLDRVMALPERVRALPVRVAEWKENTFALWQRMKEAVSKKETKE